MPGRRTCKNIQTFFEIFGRFRDLAPIDDDKPGWELGNKADGLVPLEPDTETVQNINDHR